MASWKKMAEAFGRAMHSPKVTDTQVEHFARLAERSPETERAFIKGLDEGEDIGRRVSVDDLEQNSDAKLERQFDAEVDALTDRNLKRNASDEWNDAFKQSTDKFKEQSSSLTDEDADVWRSELLRTIDILRKRGFSDGDILNTIKGK